MEILIVYNEFRKYGGERMQEPADLLGFNIPALKVKIDETKTQNGKNVNNKENLENYITEKLEPLWTTEAGKEAIQLLRDFMENDYQPYVDFINLAVDKLEIVVDLLNNIDYA